MGSWEKKKTCLQRSQGRSRNSPEDSLHVPQHHQAALQGWGWWGTQRIQGNGSGRAGRGPQGISPGMRDALSQHKTMCRYSYAVQQSFPNETLISLNYWHTPENHPETIISCCYWESFKQRKRKFYIYTVIGKKRRECTIILYFFLLASNLSSIILNCCCSKSNQLLLSRVLFSWYSSKAKSFFKAWSLQSSLLELTAAEKINKFPGSFSRHFQILWLSRHLL